MTTIAFDRLDRFAAPLGIAVRNAAATALRAFKVDMTRVRDAMRERSRKRRAAAALSGMSDTFFRDIGMHRSEIISVVLGAEADDSRRARG